MNKRKVSDWFSFFAPKVILATLIVGIIVRIVLIFHPVTTIDWGFSDWVRIFLLGIVNDLAYSSLLLIPAFIIYTFLTDIKYKKPEGYFYWIALLLLTGFVVLFDDITNQYGGVLPRIVNATLLVLTIFYTIRLFFPRIQKPWRNIFLYFIAILYLYFIIIVAVAEIVFWSEFGVRFNFIAVDYLIYTHEVIGNIKESYPIVPIFGGSLLIVGGLIYLLLRKKDMGSASILSFKRWIVSLVCLVGFVFVSIVWLHYGYRNLKRENVYVSQLQENGGWDFVEAFRSSTLDYNEFYPTMPQDQADAIIRQLCHRDSQEAESAPVAKDTSSIIKKNIVLITVESLSADFLTRYGGVENVTPSLDTLITKSLVFDNLFAAGNRTVRGLEALTLSLPPSPGESLVKRPDANGFYSVGEVLRNNGYRSLFIYGGDSYFDNMGSFFSKCGYEIVDKKRYNEEEIVFSNIWGASDEDTYRESIKIFDSCHLANQPFFAHIMTVSNHRPYTYPEGRIEFPKDPQSRLAVVKYSDWAIGDFISKSSEKEWFKETIFVIIADHCASSAGKIQLPLGKYHIPAMIYSPGFIEPKVIEKTCSQIDVMPTLLTMLNIRYEPKFYGQNILSEDFKERAFLATYQDLGYYSDNVLTILSPVRRVRQFSITQDGWSFTEKPLKTAVPRLQTEAQAFYQTISNAY